MSNWDVLMDSFSNGLIPGSEYMWIIIIVISATAAFLVGRRTVRKF